MNRKICWALLAGWIILGASVSPAAGLHKVGLPVIEVAPKAPAANRMAVLISGDGGWADIDKDIAAGLAQRGVAVVGLDALKYFWTARTPDGAANDLTHLLDYYLNSWQKERVTLIGYSLGADVLPFMVARLPQELRDHIDLVALLAPTHQTAFEFHLSDWIGGAGGAKQYHTGPEVNKLDDLPLLCFYGKEEPDSLCRDRLPGNVTIIPMTGGHHFGGAYASIVTHIIKAAKHP